jgi:adenylate cyclase
MRDLIGASPDNIGNSRRLAAILAADIAGYSRLMGANEDETVRDLKAHQAVLLPMVETFGGRIIDTAGDGILAEFASVVQAVRFALEMQRVMAERNRDRNPERRMEFRIGINFGDVVSDGSRIYGDGINIAARLESLADAGGICLSARVHEEVAGKLDAEWEDMGEQQLKNIARSVRVFRWAGMRTQPWREAGLLPPALSDKPTVAVMPFVNMSGEAEQDYFVDGMTEDIITALSYWRWFPVIARNSTFAYKGKAVNVTDVGRELGARYILEGSIRKAGARVRVNAQLADAASGHQIWARRYERELSDVFELQDELTAQLVTAIEPELSRAEEHRALRKKPHSLTAWDLSLRALSQQTKFTREGHAQAYDLLNEAVRLDPASSYALSMIALCRFHQNLFGWIENRARAFDEVFTASRQAVELDDGDYLAHAMLGISWLWSRNQHDASVAELERAVSLNPSAAFAHHLLACVLEFYGSSSEAIGHLHTVMRLDPHYRFRTQALSDLALSHLSLQQFEEGLAYADQALHALSSNVRALQRRIVCLGHLGRVQEGRAALQTLRQLQPDFSVSYLRATYPFKKSQQWDLLMRGLEPLGVARD